MRKLYAPKKLLVAVLSLALIASACGPSDVEKAERSMNRAANALNAIAKTNRELYQQNVINLADRQKVARTVGRANSFLRQAIDRSYAIDINDPNSLQLGQDQVVAYLNDAIRELHALDVVNDKIRLAVETAIALAQETISLVKAVRPKGGS